MYIHKYLFEYVYKHRGMNTYSQIYLHTKKCINECMYILGWNKFENVQIEMHLKICIYIYVYINVYIYTYGCTIENICIYTCVYIHVCIHTCKTLSTCMFEI